MAPHILVAHLMWDAGEDEVEDALLKMVISLILLSVIGLCAKSVLGLVIWLSSVIITLTILSNVILMDLLLILLPLIRPLIPHGTMIRVPPTT